MSPNSGDNISVKAITHLLKGARNITHLSLTDVSAFKQPEFHRWTQPVPAVSFNLGKQASLRLKLRNQNTQNYSSGQRAAFCVFTRDGVIKLRKWLMAKEDQRSPITWRDSTVDQRTTSESLSHYHSRQRAAAMAWLGSPPTEREPRAPLAEMMAATSSISDYGLTLGPNPVTLDEEPVASRNTVPFHRHRHPPSIERPTPLNARTPQGRIPSLGSAANWQNSTPTFGQAGTLSTLPGNHQRLARAIPPGTRNITQARPSHLDSMLEDVQQRRASDTHPVDTTDMPEAP